MPVGTFTAARLLDRSLSAVRACRTPFTRAVTVAFLVLASLSSAFAQTTVTVTAAWDANTDAATRGYLVYYGTSPGNYQWNYDAGAQTSAPLTLNRGSQYFFSVRAYDASAQLSAPSNEATIDLRTATPTATLTATLQSATSALVTWSTTNATSVTINGAAVGASGSTSVAISGATTFTLVASGSGGSVTRTASVTPTVPAPTASLTATLQGTSALVTWSTTNATAVTINGTAVGASGSTSVPVSATTTFTLVATGAGGSVTRTATVTVTQPAPTASLTATLQSSTSALVTWSTSNATSVRLNGQAVGTSGSTTVTISGATTFTLVATGAGGSVTRTASVSPSTAVLNAPTNMVGLSSGSRVTLSWRAATSGATPDRYLLFLGTKAYSTNLINGSSVGKVTSVAGDLPRGRYYARVRSAAGAAVSPFSNQTSFWVGKGVKTPSGFGVTWSGSKATFTWSQPAADGASDEDPSDYILEAGTAPGLSDIAEVHLGNVRSFSAPVPPGTYYVRIRSANGFGESDPTDDVLLTPPGTPSAPRQLVATGSAYTVTLRWQAPTDGATPTAYQIEAGSAPGLSDLGVIRASTLTSFSTPVPAGTYYVRVRALSGGVVGAASNEVVVTR